MAKKRKAKTKRKKQLAAMKQGMVWKLRLRLEAAMTLIVPLTSSLARTVLKCLVNRPRPSRVRVHVYDSKHTTSFPSGDVSSSMTFWGWVFALGLMLAKGKGAWQKALASTPALFVVLSGPARIYLGVHWASDVLGAYLFGGSWLSLSLRLYLALKKRKLLDGRSSNKQVEANSTPCSCIYYYPFSIRSDGPE